jgi:hypothetical protein
MKTSTIILIGAGALALWYLYNNGYFTQAAPAISPEPGPAPLPPTTAAQTTPTDPFHTGPVSQAIAIVTTPAPVIQPATFSTVYLPPLKTPGAGVTKALTNPQGISEFPKSLNGFFVI